MSSRNGPDSILVTKLPTNKLLADLKTLIAGHFANFGKIIRISCCATKGERTAHLQFSSASEAIAALKHGRLMQGHSLTITITGRIPGTKLLTVSPKPLRSTLDPVSVDNDSKRPGCSERKPCESQLLQSKLKDYFRGGPASLKKEEKDARSASIPSSIDVLNEAINQMPPPPPQTQEVKVTDVATEKKPNICNKVELYKGTPAVGTGPLIVSPVALQPDGATRPRRRVPSLWEIMNLDMTQMKVVKTVGPSEALACSYFNQGPQPFSMSLMFSNKISRSVIMPTNYIMDSIKPGMEIKDETLVTVLNTVLKSVLRTQVKDSSERSIRNAILESTMEETFQQLEDHVINQEVSESVERELEYEVDFLILLEDAVEAVLGLVIETNAAEELRSARKIHSISKIIHCCYRKLAGTVIAETVDQLMPDALLHCLCEEVVDDILESPIFDLHVKVVAGEALRNSLQDRTALPLPEGSSGSSSFEAQESLRKLSDAYPCDDARKRTEEWLLGHVYNVEEPDPPENFTPSTSSICTNVSCSVRTKSSQLSNDLIETLSPPTSNVTTPFNDTKPQPLVEKAQGFFGKLSCTLKRKAESIFTSFTMSKKPRIN